MRALIEATGASPMSLPPYAPGLNPAEMGLAKLETLLRDAAERAVDALSGRIGTLLDAFPPDPHVRALTAAGYDLVQTEDAPAGWRSSERRRGRDPLQPPMVSCACASPRFQQPLACSHALG